MTVGGGFRRIARILRHVERDGWRIDAVSTREGQELWTGSRIQVRFACGRNGSTASEECPMTLAEELQEFDSCRARLRRVVDADGGRLVAEFDVDVETSDPDAERQPSTGTDHETPLHKDRSRLARLYRQNETFTAMAEAVPEDVSPETIRRYMIEHDFHTPASDSEQDESSLGREEPAITADNGGPREFDPEEVIATVEQANTLYDVQRSFDLEREEALSLLRRYDVLDVVVGRLDREEDPDQRRERIRRRLRNANGGEHTVVAGRNG